MNPRIFLERGVEVVNVVLAPRDFRFQFRGEGIGSGGTFAWGEFVRDDRRLELHFRYSLGVVTYHIAELALGHEAYMRALGRDKQARYPSFSDDPLDAFRDLSYDLAELAAADFLDGSGDVFTQAATAVAADAPRRQREYMAWAAGDLENRERARERFQAGDYIGARELLESLEYPDLLTESELQMLKLARSRSR